ncbi:MAG: DNA-protecting protein DprA [Candidatus Wildermuthbacteria bacterium]|nr:DNA-protecting protein DprA [Candidatus Wildermuthbacteria bacterium]
MNRGVVAKEDERYPALLKTISDAPKKLYYKGTWDPSLFRACLAVVGTRRMTGYGKRVAEELVGEIAAAGVTIVSGFMYGVDATAHKSAVGVGGKTIAVMPCGIDVIHPEYQKDLYEAIMKQDGLIVSEYEGGFVPTLWSFPRRNRIIAGLSQATLVIEAGEKSGSLITANFAKKFHRKLFAVPGPVTSSVSQGTLKLLEEGATVVKNAQRIISWYKENVPELSQRAQGREKAVAPERDTPQKKIERNILEYLQREPMEIDNLARTLGISAAQIGTVLSLMQLNGLIAEENGKYYIKN